MNKSILRIGIGASALVALSTAASIRADDSQTTVQHAIATLNEMDRLIDGVQTRQASAGSGTSTNASVAITMKCPACGMQMSSVRSNTAYRLFSLNGKQYYCCTGCKMEGATRVRRPRPAN